MDDKKRNSSPVQSGLDRDKKKFTCPFCGNVIPVFTDPKSGNLSVYCEACDVTWYDWDLRPVQVQAGGVQCS